VFRLIPFMRNCYSRRRRSKGRNLNIWAEFSFAWRRKACSSSGVLYDLSELAGPWSLGKVLFEVFECHKQKQASASLIVLAYRLQIFCGTAHHSKNASPALGGNYPTGPPWGSQDRDRAGYKGGRQDTSSFKTFTAITNHKCSFHCHFKF
jgi:hypothetical protein